MEEHKSIRRVQEEPGKWVTLHLVRTRGMVDEEDVPEDMLRYDGCFVIGEVRTGHSGDYRVALVARVTDTKRIGKLTNARWKTFGWDVVQSYPGQRKLDWLLKDVPDITLKFTWDKAWF